MLPDQNLSEEECVRARRMRVLFENGDMDATFNDPGGNGVAR